MKNTQLVILLLAILGLTSCTRTTLMQVLQPAEMKMPDHLTVVATIDRSKPSDGFLRVVEGLFTGEQIGQDQRGRLNALEGLNDALSNTPRFQLKMTNVVMEGSKTGERISEPLSWGEIDRICKDYDADCVLAIESYDSDLANFTEGFEETYKDDDGNKQTRRRWRAFSDIGVKVGWRLYDPQKRVIVDEFMTRASERYSAEGDTERKARGGLPNMAANVFQISWLAGQRYGMRIAPVWVTVAREFYTNGKGNYKEEMKQAARYVEADNWERASEIWRGLVDQADPKTAGRAAHNLAVASERLSKLDQALQWAERAYVDFGNKSSRGYMQILRQRMADDELLDYQLNEGG